ncbi:MAG: acetylxylan esterase [Armatimonadetes bacterium]|nr:acetylxylan esterase [Armatimonadota bacterium]
MPAQDAVRVEPVAGGGYRCTTAQYSATVAADGSLASLSAAGTEFLGSPCGFARGNGSIPLVTVKPAAPDTLVAEGAPKDAAKSVAGSPCPFEARVTYHFLPDRLELTLEQSLDLYGGFAWVPSAAVTAARDALTDCATLPAGPLPYGQTDPRWTTTAGPVLRFDFGVWQRGFANASWGSATIDGMTVHSMRNTVPATLPMKITVFPLPHPAPRDALTFDIAAASPDFLLPGGQPVHFDLTVTNAGPDAVDARVTFEVRDYLTQQPVTARATEVKLPPGGATALPTDLALEQPGPYRGAIVVNEGDQLARSFWWVFTYDFQHYAPPTTRQPDFEAFWREALAESAALPLDARLTPVPEKGNAAADAFRISFATLGGRRIYGWYARPKAPGRHPAQIRFPSSGIYPLPGPELFADRSSLWIQIHGFDVDLSNMPAGDNPGKGYWTAGIAGPKTSMWRTIYISLVRAVDFMLAQAEVDPRRVAVVGGSQGGGLCMVAAALDHRIGFALPYHSGLPRLDWTVTREPGYWPFGMAAKPAGQSDEEFLRTLSYFDPANLTQDIRCPIAAEIGLMDTVTAAGNQICALSHVPPGLLYLVCSPWAMHGAGSRDSSLAAACYARFVKGEPPIVEPTKAP